MFSFYPVQTYQYSHGFLKIVYIVPYTIIGGLSLRKERKHFITEREIAEDIMILFWWVNALTQSMA